MALCWSPADVDIGNFGGAGAVYAFQIFIDGCDSRLSTGMEGRLCKPGVLTCGSSGWGCDADVAGIDDELTEAPELGSAAVGRAQGFYIASSEEGVSQTLAVTAMFNEGGFEDTISFFGVHRSVDSESHLAIVGGTGKYVGAKGFAKVAVVRPGGVVASGALLETDGIETVLQFTLFLV